MLLRIFFHVFYSSGKHQLDTVQLVYFAGSGIVVNGNNIGFRMRPADLLDHALAYDMVWQAAERLDADDIRYAAVDQLQHFSCKEPAFSGLVSRRDDRSSHFRQDRGYLQKEEKWRLCSRASLAALRSQSIAFDSPVCNCCLWIF